MVDVGDGGSVPGPVENSQGMQNLPPAMQERPPSLLGDVFISLKIFGTADDYDVVAVVMGPPSLGSDVLGARIRDISSGKIAGRVVDELSSFWPVYSRILPGGFHIAHCMLSELATFGRNPDGTLQLEKDLRLEVVDEFAQPFQQDAEFYYPARQSLPIPPRDNIIRVAGDVGLDGFLFGGATWFVRLRTLVRRYVGRDLGTLQHVLDWGVGCGRVARSFFEHGLQNVIYGVDIDAVNIEWMQANMPDPTRFTRCDFDPPLSFPDHFFDVIYGHSVFTHLREEDQFRWLDELARLLRPGGFAFVTACTESGVAVTRHWDVPNRADFSDIFLNKGFYDFEAQPVGVDAGREGYYRLVAHTRRYIAERWSAHFNVRRIIPCLMEHQDLVVLQKR
jgi:SAM-dependent methyltransferase